MTISGMANLPLPNPLAIDTGNFFSRLMQTRQRLEELRQWSAETAGTEPAAPLLSVMLITYNHEKYIAQALDSILMQDRDFEIEINVIDDASTDRTQEIVREYSERNPGIINCYFNPRNVGHIATQFNTLRGFQTLRGKYFALLEGDDYWTDPQKLKKQTSFLENNLDFVACAHNTLKIYDDGSRAPEHFLPFKYFKPERFTMHHLVNMAGVFHFSSTVFRNVFGLNPPHCLADPASCEVIIGAVYAQYGDVYCIDEYMSAYRVHAGGVFSSRSVEKIWLFHLAGFRHFSIYLGFRYLYLFAPATYRFCRYVLWQPADTVAIPLSTRSKAIFWVHMIASLPLWFASTFRPGFRPDFSRKKMKKLIPKKIRARFKKKTQKGF